MKKKEKKPALGLDGAEKPVSLHPLTVEEALRDLLRSGPTAATQDRNNQQKRRDGSRDDR